MFKRVDHLDMPSGNILPQVRGGRRDEEQNLSRISYPAVQLALRPAVQLAAVCEYDGAFTFGLAATLPRPKEPITLTQSQLLLHTYTRQIICESCF